MSEQSAANVRPDGLDLRQLVRDVLRELAPTLRSAAGRGGAGGSPAPSGAGAVTQVAEAAARRVSAPAQGGSRRPKAARPERSGPAPAATPPASARAASATREDTVALRTDAELADFIRRLLQLFDNPKSRADLRSGRLRFRLAGPAAALGPAAQRRIEAGAVTERQVSQAARDGVALLLSPRAVLTPLARDKARALGVTIQRDKPTHARER